MDEKKYYVYVTTNLINGKQYVGEHWVDAQSYKYIGSGDALKLAIKKYGKINFKCDIVEWYDTRKEAFDAQEIYINSLNTQCPNGYNISPKGGHGVVGCIAESTKEKIRVSRGVWTHTEEAKEKMRGRIASDETKKILSEIRKNQVFSEESRCKAGLSLQKHYEGNPRIIPQDVCDKISKTMTGRTLPQEHCDNISKAFEKKRIEQDLPPKEIKRESIVGENNPNYKGGVTSNKREWNKLCESRRDKEKRKMWLDEYNNRPEVIERIKANDKIRNEKKREQRRLKKLQQQKGDK